MHLKKMTIRLPYFIPALVAGLFYADAGYSGELTISLDNPPESGTIELMLYANADAFGAIREPDYAIRHELDGSEKYRLDNIEPGNYALFIYYDENNNGRIDKNFIGIPTEPLGFSNRYAPKAPPSFSRAAFTIGDEPVHFDVELYKPLGEIGRIGVGVGLIARSSPYLDYNGTVSQLIPAITYTSERLQIYGPNIQYGIVGSGDLRLAVTGQYRIGAYEESDSPALIGLGDRDDTALLGLALQAELPALVELQLGYEHDVLDRIGGGQATLGISRGFQSGILLFTPKLALNYLSEEMTSYDYGVPANKATASRPAYSPGSTTSVEAGLGLFIEITREWLFVLDVNYEKLGSDITDSPIVDKDYVVKGFAALNYVF